MAWAREVLPLVQDGTVLIARHLEHARGRQGRRWLLAPGQITHTVVLKPVDVAIEQGSLAALNMALTLGLQQALRAAVAFVYDYQVWLLVAI